jgi:hypothetical protein
MFRYTGTAVAITLLALGGQISTASAAGCSSFRGIQEEVQVTGPECGSPVGFCTVAQLRGTFRGEAGFSATAIVPTIDTPVTGVVLVLGDTTVTNARLAGKRGTISIKNAATFRTTGDGDLSDTQVIVGGTGDFAGATGSIRVSGTFTAGAGTANVEGTVCVP